MLDHIHAMDQRLEEMCRGLKSLGAEVADMQLPDLGSCELDSAYKADPVDTGESHVPSPEDRPPETKV